MCGGQKLLVPLVGPPAPAPRFHCESLPVPHGNWQ